MRRLPSTDGVEVAVHDLGGAAGAAALVVAHATGFCAGVYRPVASRLPWRAYGLDLRGHGPSTLPVPPGTDGIWRGFADDVLAAIDGLGLVTPVVGFGHSSGGAAVLMAEAARPGTFSALWCFEPIIWPDPDEGRARAARIAAGARRRRDRFASRQEAYDNFASKPPFTSLTPEALRAYVEDGFHEEPDGTVTLRCSREVEADVYLRALDDDRFARLPQVRCPVVVAAGGHTDAITPVLAGRLAGALPQGRLRVFEDLSHFGPLEDPPAIASALVEDLT